MTRSARTAVLAVAMGLIAATLPFRSIVAAATLAQPADAGKPAEQSLSAEEVRALQDALVWTGDYSGLVNGTGGPRTRDAIAAYLKRTGAPATGSLDAGTRARLLAEAKARRQAVGFAPVSDKRTGLVFALPMRLLPRETGTDAGTRFSSADGEIVVDTLARPATEGSLPDIFARMSATAATRKVFYKLLRPDFFVVSGEVGDHAFYSRFAAGKADGADAVRGFTLTYPKAAAARWDAVALAVAASFDPFPAAGKAAAVAGGVQHLGVSGALSVKFAEAVLVGSGLALSRVSHLDCPSPQIDGVGASYRLEDDRTGLALLSVPGKAAYPVPVATTPVAEGETLFALFHGDPDQSGQSGPLLAAPAQARQGDESGFIVSAPFQTSAASPPLFDRSGALVGVAESDKKSRATIAGTVPQADYRITGAAALLDRAGVARPTFAQPASRGLGEVASALRPSIVSVSCEADKTAVP